MKDLKKHAIQEYNELILKQSEAQFNKQKNKKKKKKPKNKKTGDPATGQNSEAN